MSKTNGTEEVREVSFKKNVDFFEMAEGTFYTVDALIKKYHIGRSTVYNKARDAGIEVVKIASFPCFMDDGNAFSKKERVYNTKHLKPMTSYGELTKIIKEISEFVLATNTRTFSHTAEITTIRKEQMRLLEAVYRIETTLSQILDHLTKEKDNAY